MNLAEAKAGGLANTKNRQAHRARSSGSGNGKTAGRGHKGAKARSGWSRRIAWEGGQMPLFRRIPKRGFNNKNFKKVFTIVNVGDFAGFDDGAVVDLNTVLEAGLASQAKHSNLFKVLGNGELANKLTVKLSTRSAPVRAQKVEAAGGTVELIPPRRPASAEVRQKKPEAQGAAPA